MSRQDQITKRKGRVGNKVSHSKRRTKMKQELNLQMKRFAVAGKTVKLKVSTKTLKIIRKLGVEAAIKKFNSKGV